MSRRTCQYRQEPLLFGNIITKVDCENSISPTVSPGSSQTVASKKKRRSVGSTSFLRIGNHSAATTFAAAISPTAASSKISLNVMAHAPSTPLLGNDHTMKRSSPDTSLSCSRGSSSARNFLTHKKKGKRRNISKTIQAPLKPLKKGASKIVSKLSGKKSSKKLTQRLPSGATSISGYESFASGSGSGTPGAIQSPDSLDSSLAEAAEDAAQSTSLEPLDEGLTALQFDETKVPNHFRLDTSGPESPFSKEEDFALHKVLSPCSDDEYHNFLKIISANRSDSAFEECKIPPVPQLGDEDDDDHSIPSIVSTGTGRLQVSADDENLAVSPQLQDTTNKEDAADSVLAWSCLTAILGAPAPRSVLQEDKKKKRSSVNLWQDDDAVDEELEALSLPEDIPSDNELAPVSPEDENREKFDQILQGTLHRRKAGKASTPPAFYDSYFFEMQRQESEEDNCSLPSLSAQHDDDGAPILNDTPAHAAITPKSSNNEIDSTLAWTALAAILGSPAPKSTVKRSRKEKQKVWDTADNEADVLPEIEEDMDGELEMNDMLDAILSLDQDHCVPTMVVNDPLHDNKVSDEKGAADSALAWGALAAVLGSPAPTSVLGKKKRRSKGSVTNLWDDGSNDEGLDEMPSFAQEGVEEEFTKQRDHATQSTAESAFGMDASQYDDDDAHSIPSLSGTYDTGSSSPLTLASSLGSSSDGFPSPSKEIGKKNLTDNVLAWGALGALLGAPAPKAALRPKRRSARDLWSSEAGVDACEPSGLTLELEDSNQSSLLG
mmetsp:Transcript_37262/g.78586  ORF Transcript_37262/g.78586 Transcript_37262/m.78586 type:complete len:777 (-) Transcript_37262:254-2584(-)